jgi:hypothetical protein
VPVPIPGNGTVTTTIVVNSFVTYCPRPTVITHKDHCYTAKTPGPLTITNCPCTITTVSPHNNTRTHNTCIYPHANTIRSRPFPSQPGPLPRCRCRAAWATSARLPLPLHHQGARAKSALLHHQGARAKSALLPQRPQSNPWPLSLPWPPSRPRPRVRGRPPRPSLPT